MGIFDDNEEKLKALYHRAWVGVNCELVNPRKYPYWIMHLFALSSGNIKCCAVFQRLRLIEFLRV